MVTDEAASSCALWVFTKYLVPEPLKTTCKIPLLTVHWLKQSILQWGVNLRIMVGHDCEGSKNVLILTPGSFGRREIGNRVNQTVT